MLAHQLYSLFYDGHGAVTASRLAQLPEVAWSQSSQASATAGANPLFLSYDLKCDQNAAQSTSAGKFRLSGAICGGETADGRKPSSVATLSSIQVFNLANKFSATVFTDSVAGKFSTDYIPLNPGKNPIRVEFRYADEHVTSRDFVVDKASE